MSSDPLANGVAGGSENLQLETGDSTKLFERGQILGAGHRDPTHRPAAGEGDRSDAAVPRPRTRNAGSAIEPGITPNSPTAAGVAPLRCTTSSFSSWTSFHAKL